ncbi:MAG: terminase small subunit [Clostridia bacterium]|nr:terminase small subunit [Clostridia bacterium]
MENKARKLTERQRRFADLYLKLGNACEAAEQAGFRRSYAQAAKKQPAVQAYMEARLDEIRKKDVASADEVLSYLTAVMRGDIEGEKPEKNSSPRMKAAELLGRRLGIFSDVNAILKPEMPVIIDDIPETEPPARP